MTCYPHVVFSCWTFTTMHNSYMNVGNFKAWSCRQRLMRQLKTKEVIPSTTKSPVAWSVRPIHFQKFRVKCTLNLSVREGLKQDQRSKPWPTWSLFRPIWPIGPIMTNYDIIGPIWSYTVLFGLIYSYLELFGPILPHLTNFNFL